MAARLPPAVPTTEATRGSEDGQATPAAVPAAAPAAPLQAHAVSTAPDSHAVAAEDGAVSEPSQSIGNVINHFTPG